MRTLKRTKKINLISFLPMLGLFLLLIFLIVCNINVFEKTIRLKRGLQGVKLLAIPSGSVQDDSDLSLEKIAREELNYKKPGEQAVAFPMVDNSTTSHKMDLEGKPFWQWIISKTRE